MIEFIKEVVFHDQHGSVIKTYAIGDRIKYTAKTEHYWVTPMGGIYFDEAKEVGNE